MPTIVRSGGGGTDVSAANATTSQVLSGATFYSNASDDIQTGTMSNKGAVSQAAPYSGSAGYYSSISITTTGTATNAHVLSGKTFMNANGAQTGTMTNKGAATINVGETGGAGYYSSIAINKSSLGNAKAEHVLNTVTFTNNAGTTQNGTMINRGSINQILSYNANVKGSAGYYSSINITAPGRYGDATAAYVYNGKTFMNSTTNSTGTLTLNGTAGEANVLSGKTFHAGNSITQKTGTMTNRGQFYNNAVTTTWTNLGAGYYTSVNVKAAAVSTSDYYSIQYFSVGASYCNTGITYNSSRQYGVAYTSFPDGPSVTNKNGLKFFSSSGYLYITQQASSACQQNVRLITIK